MKIMLDCSPGLIALEPAVYESLKHYAKRIWGEEVNGEHKKPVEHPSEDRRAPTISVNQQVWCGETP